MKPHTSIEKSTNPFPDQENVGFAGNEKSHCIFTDATEVRVFLSTSLASTTCGADVHLRITSGYVLRLRKGSVRLECGFECGCSRKKGDVSIVNERVSVARRVISWDRLSDPLDQLPALIRPEREESRARLVRRLRLTLDNACLEIGRSSRTWGNDS